jgi:hypothetical protein
MVVSDMGEQWSPKIAPARTDAVAPKRISIWSPPGYVAAPPKETVRGITSGSMIAIVPHEVPVAKAIAAQVTKTINGINCRPTRSDSSRDKYCAVPIASVTDPSDQARVNMIIAIIIAFMPPSHASIHSCTVSILCPIEIRIATRHPASDPHNRVENGSASANTSLREASGPTLVRPVV